jgi:hypothetical protein
VTGNVQIKPLASMQVPLKARQELRQTLLRWLSHLAQGARSHEEGAEIDGCTLLDLCTHYRVQYPGGAADLLQSWNSARCPRRTLATERSALVAVSGRKAG